MNAIIDLFVFLFVFVLTVNLLRIPVMIIAQLAVVLCDIVDCAHARRRR